MPHATPPYDEANVFARILRGEIPARTVLETPHALAFHDIGAQAPFHVLVIPRGPYADLAHFLAKAPAAEQAGFWDAVARVCAMEEAAGGFRVVANAGRDAHQEVPHFHLHVLAGRALGPILTRP